MCTISQKWVWQVIRMTFHRATVQRVYLWESTFTNFAFLWQFLKVLSLKSTRIISKHVLPTSRDVPCNLCQLLPHAKTFPTKYWWWPCLFIFSSLFPFTKAGWSSIDSGTCFDHHGCNKDEMGQLPISWNITTSTTNLQKKFISLYF